MNVFKSMTYPHILFEDNHLLIVNKRPGDIVQGDKTGDMPLSELMKQYLKEKYQKPGNVFLGVVHRLDRPASGIVIFARTSKSLVRLNEMFKQREIQKKYWLVTKGKPAQPSATLIDYVCKNEKQNKSYVCKATDTNALKAELNYTYLSSIQNYHLLEVALITGRHHQIRVQMANIGCVIKGDLKYGFNRSNADGSIHLHAHEVQFIHPVSKEAIKVIADPPADPVWTAFASI